MSHAEPSVWDRLSDSEKAMLAVAQSFTAATVAAVVPGEYGIALGALIAYLLVFYQW